MSELLERFAQVLTDTEFDRLLELRKGGVAPPFPAVPIPPAPLTPTPPVPGNSQVKRITNAGPNNWIIHEYSTIDCFNPNGTRMLLFWAGGNVGLHDGITGQFLRMLPDEVSHGAEPRWSRHNPNLFYLIQGRQLRQFDVSTNTQSIVHSFSEYSSISGKGEADISEDGNHLVLCGDGQDLFVYDISRDRKGEVLHTKAGVESLYLTAENLVVVSWAGDAGISLHDANFNFIRKLTAANGHKDVCRNEQGEGYLIWTNSNDPKPIACRNGIVKVELATGKQTCLLELDWSLAVHISCPDAGRFALVSTYRPDESKPDTPYTNKILKVMLDGSGAQVVCDHKSKPFNTYNWEPKASVSRDGSRFVFSSNGGVKGSNPDYSDVYMGFL